MSRYLALPVAAALFSAVVYCQGQIDARLGAFRATEEAIYLWKGEQVKRLVPGFENLAADLYWLRTVQYFGGQRLFAKGKKFELLEPLTEITTTLDPRLEIAYRYGATFLSEPQPVGAGRPREGIALLEKGAAEIPGSWRLRQDLGFFIFFFLKDGPRAARVLMEAAKIPGAGYWLEGMAAEIMAKGGDRAASRRMWQQIHDQAEGDFIKSNAREHLLALDALDQADRVQRAVLAFAKRFGARPRTLGELQVLGIPARALADPDGVPFDYDPATGTVAVSRKSPSWRPE